VCLLNKTFEDKAARRAGEGEKQIAKFTRSEPGATPR
jgi:hypothetical protein